MKINGIAVTAVLGAAVLVAGAVSVRAQTATESTPTVPGRTTQQRSSQQGSTVQPGIGSTQQGQSTPSMQRVTALLNLPVETRDGRTEGWVKDIVLSADRQRVEYVAFMIGNDQYAVPLSELSLARDGRALSVASSQAQLQQSRRFTGDQWPSSVTSLKGPTMSQDDAHSRRVSQFIGTQVRDSQGRWSGTIDDLVISMSGGPIQTAVFRTSPAGVGQSSSGKLSSVNWTAVQMQPQQGFVTVNPSQQRWQDTAADEQQYWQQFGFEGEQGNAQPGTRSGTGQQDNGKQPQQPATVTTPGGQNSPSRIDPLQLPTGVKGATESTTPAQGGTAR